MNIETREQLLTRFSQGRPLGTVNPDDIRVLIESSVLFEAPRFVSVTSQTKTLSLEDSGVIQQCSYTGTQTITIPTNASVAFPIGTLIPFENIGSTILNLLGSTGVTVIVNGLGTVTETGSQETLCNLSSIGSSAYIRKTSTNSWIASGFYV